MRELLNPHPWNSISYARCLTAAQGVATFHQPSTSTACLCAEAINAVVKHGAKVAEAGAKRLPEDHNSGKVRKKKKKHSHIEGEQHVEQSGAEAEKRSKNKHKNTKKRKADAGSGSGAS